tara:strand:- start:64 stop:375 length:312 start_codon:yes stop_codon:yes gene_type:complete
MLSFVPNKEAVVRHLHETIIDIIDNHHDYSIDLDCLLLQDIAFILKQSFKVNNLDLYIDGKKRSILSFIKIVFGGLKKYINNHTDYSCSLVNDNNEYSIKQRT